MSGPGSLTVSEVIVQMFEGEMSKQGWMETLRFARQNFNPHLLSIIGISPISNSGNDMHYIVFAGAHRMNTRHLLASALIDGDQTILAALGMQVAYGIASALDYLSRTCTATCLSNVGAEYFEVFSNDKGHTVLSLAPEFARLVPCDEETSDAVICNSFISKVGLGH
ncbi:hypothetical protein GYMLUDRAFT_76561 [Collybiopsis luxurians FD-317 M1]|uniref:Uncharacterized protein n=1 Tax=Collybiopsis luxurians FD-317 M1 TaxID=944289 RepID=A0A0D0CJV6_9AGAR|nr:hypothetical protein GYMLUDRAFT_76561 [Collybiopsis luxurians FD-317 M1]